MHAVGAGAWRHAGSRGSQLEGRENGVRAPGVCAFQVYKRPLYSQVSVFESSELNTKANIQAVRRPGRSSPKLLCLLFSIFLLACGVRASD